MATDAVPSGRVRWALFAAFVGGCGFSLSTGSDDATGEMHTITDDDLTGGKVTDGVIAWEKAVFQVDLKKLTRGQAVKMVEIYVRLFTVADHRRNTRHFDTYQDNALFWIREAMRLGWVVRTGAQYRKWRAPFIADVQALLKAAGK